MVCLVLCCVLFYSVVLYHFVLCCLVLYCVVLCYAVLCYVVLCFLLCYVGLYLWCYFVFCYFVLCCVALYVVLGYVVFCVMLYVILCCVVLQAKVLSYLYCFRELIHSWVEVLCAINIHKKRYIFHTTSSPQHKISSAVFRVDLIVSCCCVHNAEVFRYTGASAGKRLMIPGLALWSDSDDNGASPLIPAVLHLHAFKSPLLCEEHKFNLHRATLLHITLRSRTIHTHTRKPDFVCWWIERLQCHDTVCKSPFIRFEVGDEETNSSFLSSSMISHKL